MIQKTHMAIDAYLRNAGLKSVQTTNRKAFIPLKNSPVRSFSEALGSATSPGTSESNGKNKGLTISDYFKQAIPRASTDVFQTSTIGSNTLDPGRPDGFQPVSLSSRGGRMAAASAPLAGPTVAHAEVAAQPDNNVLIADSIKKAAGKYNLPAKLIESVIQAESNFRVDAVSPAGAQGLMQLMPGTAKELGVDDPFDVHQNIDGGSAYLRQMLNRFGGDVKLALAAYNAGPGTVEKYNGNVPYRETQAYIERVLNGVSA
jgi:soluble lytic murein transglycosylase-like protein